MKIWYIHPYAGGPGIGRYWRTFHLAKEWVRSGHDVTIITAGYHHLMDSSSAKHGLHKVEGVTYFFVPTIKYKGNGVSRFFSMLLFSVSLFFSGIHLIIKNKPDLMIYSSAHPFGYMPTWVLAKFSKAKIFFEIRDLWPLSLLEIAGFKERHPIIVLLSLIERFAYATADVAISLLPGAKQHMVARGLSPEKFVYVSNGFSLSDERSITEFDSHPMVADIARFKSQGDFLFFYAGAFGEPNAMHKFIDSLAFFDALKGPRVKFILVGRGEQEQELKNRCKASNYDFVSFYPQVDKQVVLAALQYVDAGFFVMHDLPVYRFGISLNKVFDYMSASVPVVGAYRSFNDPVSESGCGLSIPPDDPKRLAETFEFISMQSKENLRSMGERGRLYLEEHYEYAVLAKRILNKL